MPQFKCVAHSNLKYREKNWCATWSALQKKVAKSLLSEEHEGRAWQMAYQANIMQPMDML